MFENGIGHIYIYIYKEKGEGDESSQMFREGRKQKRVMHVFALSLPYATEHKVFCYIYIYIYIRGERRRR